MARIEFNFEKPTISKGVLDFLSANLIEDPDTSWDKVKKNLKESLASIAKGHKLDYGSANYLLHRVLGSLSLEDSSVEDEITPADSQHAKGLDGLDGLLTQIDSQSTEDPESAGTGRNPKTERTPPNSGPNQKKTKETCKFYARGRCNRGKDCRFDHPTICKKFRQFGSKTSERQKGCDGKCSAYHPNVCRRSLKDRTCSFRDCRFFHLKGTKMLSQDSASELNWRVNNQPQNKGRASQNMGRPQLAIFESKNQFACLENPNTGQAGQQQDPERILLNHTLEAIMKRLTDMETRQAMYQPPHNRQKHNPVQPNTVQYSPVVPQPGTQTQRQWESQNQWTQSQY